MKSRRLRHPLARQYGAHLQAVRKCLGLTLEQLAERVGVSRQTVLDWQAGKTLPQAHNLERIAQVTGQPVYRFFLGELDQVVVLERQRIREISLALAEILRVLEGAPAQFQD